MTDKTLIERLRKVESNAVNYTDIATNWYRNPDGPEAADTIETQASQIASLTAALKGIKEFGRRHTGHGYSCALLAEEALSPTPTDTDKGEG